MTPPIRFCLGLHLHQPVGNFGSVFEQHMDEVYLPFLLRARDAGFLPVTLHISGPLLEWMEQHDRRYLDLVGELAANGRVELLLSGMYEPVLVALPREDRLEQIHWMRDTLRRLFGVDARGLWLTERVWESELAADLHDAGVRYALVDDRHFVVSGFERDRLHAPFVTESGGKRVTLFPIDEKLRYLVPFQPPSSTVDYLRWLRATGQQLAVLADDGEKFGGWPGTRKWVYTDGWLDKFFAAIADVVGGGEVQLSTFADALHAVPSGGLAYLGTASYREMEGWSLPPERAERLNVLERELGQDRMAGPDGALVRGSHWRNFFVKYPEANRMHKKMLALSEHCRREGDPVAARRAIARAQCNDAYWHGVFGGLYLPHLREAVWRNLALAERDLRAEESLNADVLDFDGDGHAEVWAHSPAFSAIVSPRRGGGIEEWTQFASGVNLADTLTRRREVYHRIDEQAAQAAVERAASALRGESTAGAGDTGEDAAPSIHELEARARLTTLPAFDRNDRAILVERLIPGDAAAEAYAAGLVGQGESWARTPLTFDVARSSSRIVVRMASDADGALFTKKITFTADGAFTVEWTWSVPPDAGDWMFLSELSLARDAAIEAHDALLAWRYEIETVAMSERGFDRTRQGTAEVRGWPAAAGRAAMRVRPAPTARGG